MKNDSKNKTKKESNEKLEINEKLRLENKELSKQLARVNDKLKGSEKFKSNFLANMMNEIINPYTSIMSLSKNIVMLDRNDWDKAAFMAELIYSEASDLDFQLNNIFVAAEIEAGEAFAQISNIEINSLIQDAIDKIKFKAEKKNIGINAEYIDCPGNQKKPLNFTTDYSKLRLILTNFLNNAIKYSNPGGRIKVLAVVENKKAKITVQDFGTGIEKEDFNTIFDRFRKLDSDVNSLNTGHGLGLSVAKALSDILEGEITIKTERNKGSSFTIIVPEAEPDDDTFLSEGDEIIF